MIYSITWFKVLTVPTLSGKNAKYNIISNNIFYKSLIKPKKYKRKERVRESERNSTNSHTWLSNKNKKGKRKCINSISKRIREKKERKRGRWNNKWIGRYVHHILKKKVLKIFI